MISVPSPTMPTPLVMPITSLWCAWGAYRATWSPGVPVSSTNPAANQAIYVPFVVTTAATFTRGFWYNGATLTGNVSVGIYDEAGNRLATTGAVARTAASSIESAAFTAAVTLAPGRYYMAILFAAATATGCFAYVAAGFFRVAGIVTQATGVAALPATAVYATWASMVLPYFGITQTSFAI